MRFPWQACTGIPRNHITARSPARSRGTFPKRARETQCGWHTSPSGIVTASIQWVSRDLSTNLSTGGSSVWMESLAPCAHTPGRVYGRILVLQIDEQPGANAAVWCMDGSGMRDILSLWVEIRAQLPMLGQSPVFDPGWSAGFRSGR